MKDKTEFFEFAEGQDRVDPLLRLIPKEQCYRVFNQMWCDIDPTFLGFTNVYCSLASIIPKHYTVIDLGCAYNPQSFWFIRHKKFIAVDIGKIERFCAPNCQIFEKDIIDFIKDDISELDLNETFAICSYVPLNDEKHKLVRSTFKNLFMYYPSGFSRALAANSKNSIHETSI